MTPCRASPQKVLHPISKHPVSCSYRVPANKFCNIQYRFESNAPYSAYEQSIQRYVSVSKRLIATMTLHTCEIEPEAMFAYDGDMNAE